MMEFISCTLYTYCILAYAKKQTKLKYTLGFTWYELGNQPSQTYSCYNWNCKTRM